MIPTIPPLLYSYQLQPGHGTAAQQLAQMFIHIKSNCAWLKSKSIQTDPMQYCCACFSR
jgi:hypothetical protein